MLIPKRMKYIDSKVVVLNNETYLVYLKRVPVRESKEGKREIIRAFVKKIRKRKKLGIIKNYIGEGILFLLMIFV